MRKFRIKKIERVDQFNNPIVEFYVEKYKKNIFGKYKWVELKYEEGNYSGQDIRYVFHNINLCVSFINAQLHETVTTYYDQDGNDL